MKLFSKALCIFLSAVMLLYLIPNEAYNVVGSAAEQFAKADDATEPQAEVIALDEEISKRTASTKTIRMSDGSYRLVQYANDVHYEDNGEWVEYDNSLTLSTASTGDASLNGISKAEPPALKTADNPSGLKFGQSSSDKLVSFTNDNKKLEMSIVGNSKNSYAVQQIQTADFVPADRFEELTAIENYSSSVMYSNVFDNAHIKYTAAGNQVKEEIVVFKKADKYEYSFDFSLTGLDAKLQSDGSIIFTDAQTDTIEYYIPVGYMYDDDGNSSSAVRYSLTQTSTGCTVTVTADAEWVNASDRAFPVVIDPTVVFDNYDLYQYNEMRDTDSYVGNPNQAAFQNGYIRVGNTDGHHYNGYISLYMEDGEEEFGFILPNGSVITSAKLYLDVAAVNTATTVYMHAITDDWNHKANPWVEPSVEEEIVDYQVISSTSQACVFDFTSIVQSCDKTLTEQTSLYKGFRLSSTASNGYVKFVSLNNTNNGANPYFVISYRDTKGIESRWSYSSHGAGAAGAGAVNLYTGNLVFTHDDLSANGNILPLTVSHVYNSHYVNQQYTNVDGDIHTSDYTNMKVGKGWKLSIQESIVEKDLSDGSTWYIYNDADGTELYFYYDSDKGGYISEDGYDLIITKDEVRQEYTMSDSFGNTKKFNSAGKLYEIKDMHGNKRTLYYDNGRVSSIAYSPYQGISTTHLNFTYNSNNALSRITNSKTGEYVTFAYSATYDGTANSSYSGFLRTITYSNGIGNCSYEYFSSGRLKRATDTATGSQIVYSYDTAYNYSSEYAQIKSAAEYTSASVLGQMIGFEYTPELTKVKTSGNDDAYGTDDDIITTYVFDDWGRTISAYTTDKNGNKVYGASNAVYNETALGSKKNNTITKDSISGVPAINLITNSSFESSSGWTGYYSGSGYTGGRSTEKAFLGTHSYKLQASGGSGFRECRKTYTVSEEGTYTLSAYVNANISAATTGFRLELGGVSSRKLQTSTNADIQNGWQRISVTAHLEAGTHDVRALLQNATGTAYVDCVQLEKADGASKYNLLNNSSLSINHDGWTGIDIKHSENAAMMAGAPSAQCKISQTVAVNKPINTTFVLSGWGKANSVGRRGASDSTTDPNFDLIAVITYSDGTTEETKAPFSTDNSEWQFTSGAVVSKKTDTSLIITSITVTADYSYNANTAYFKNLCLAMEPAQTYVYDDDGNLTSATNAEGNKIGAEYSDDGVDITSYTNIVGQKYNYYYEFFEAEKAHLASRITATGIGENVITTYYGYDSYGNTNSTIITGLDFEKFLVTTSITNSSGLTTQTTDERGNATNYSYDANTELLKYVETANGARTAYLYDNGYRVTDVYNDKNDNGSKDTAEEYVNYTYNSKNQLTSIETDTVEYSLIYNSFGAQSEIKAGNKTLATYTYNSKNGKLIGTSYGNNFTITNVYDELDRLVEVKYNNAVAYTVSYNGDGAVSKIVDNRSGITTEYDYDSLGRLIHASEYNTNTKAAVLNTENLFDEFGRPEISVYDLPNLDIKYNVYYKDNTNIISSFRQSSSIDGFTPNKKVYTYDRLERVTKIEYRYNDTPVFTESLTYVDNNNRTSYLVATHKIKDELNGTNTLYAYTYDAVGNITSIKKNGADKYLYEYDSLGQLTKETICSNSATEASHIYIYSYDKAGNITERKHSEDGVLSDDGASYTYSTGTWGDLLRWYNGQEITYDAIGNPLKWRNANNIEWVGRQLSNFAMSNGSVVGYSYNSDGIRTRKTLYSSGGDPVGYSNYTLDGSKIVAENRTGTMIYYTYDDKGTIMGMIYNGQDYIFSKNLQGDVIGIYNSSRQLVAKYEYSAYGRIISITNGSGVDVSNNASHIANINPFRYRGYYYDTETGFYYLQSRYYDPIVGRFLNADVFVSTGQGIIGNNMFAYCGNNPVMRADPAGCFFEFLKNAFTEIGKAMGAMSPAYAGFGGVAVIDGPLPFGDAVAAIGITVLTIGAIGIGVHEATRAPSISIPKVEEKEDVLPEPPPIIETTYYHVTTPEAAEAIMASGFMVGSRWEGGYIYAWRTKPNKYAIRNSGAHFGVIISFKTRAPFVMDTGISDVKVQKYGPVVSVLPGPIAVWDVQIVG